MPLLEGKTNRETILCQDNSPLSWHCRAATGPPQSPSECVCVLRDISAAWHHPQSLASSGEEYGTVPSLPRGSGQEGTLPGADT